MKAHRIKALAVLCLTTLPWAAGATDLRFEQGSLIIPMQRAYQDECGAVAAYGLVYRLLQNHITVYWAVNPNKASHHRCQNSVYPKNGSDGVKPTAAEAKAMDGCDLTVATDSGYPVSLLDNVNAVTKVNNTWATYDTSSYAPNNTGEKSFTVDSNDKYLRYMGGPFVIDATQAAAARKLIQDNADFANFRSTTACYKSGSPQLGTAFHVNVHVANNAFVAPVARVMNQLPPPIALVKGNAVDVLIGYLQHAGLQSDASQNPPNQGTFESHGLIFDVLDENTDLSSSAAYPDGKLNYAPDPSNPRKTYYQVMWAPHWEGDVKNHSTQLASTLANIAHFVDLGNSSFNECASIQTYENGYSPDDKTVRFSFVNNTPTRFFTGNITTTLLGGVDTRTVNPVPGVQTTQGELAAMNSGAGFAPSGQDCSDTATGDCYMYGNYADLFTQKGDYKLVVTSGLVEAYRPRPNQTYELGTSRMFYTKSRDTKTASADGWDIFITRQKDNNALKGKLIYLGGHSFDNSAAGSRLVLNTLLNLSFRPDAQETSRSEPVNDIVYKRDSNGKILRNDDGTALIDTANVLSGTFMNLEPQALFPERNYFYASKAADWMYPYVQGRFRSLIPGQISEATQAYDKSGTVNWEADSRLPLPNTRTVFTVLGDNQNGLVRVPFSMDQVTPGKCRDDLTTGPLKTVCDLEEALNIDRETADLTTLDADGDGKIDTKVTQTQKDTNTRWNEHFVQRVLGYCVSYDKSTNNSNFQPSLSQCNNGQFGEVVAHLGGLDHASAAVVGYSSYIKPAKVTDPQRPDVAYIGGLDGQLHAIYLRGTVPNKTPKAGEELWSFIPRWQLDRLATNNARVDISPVVSDVFVDYDVTGNTGTIAPNKRHTNKFVWRTVLVAGSGRLGGELFALDVTDPLSPIVLWDVSAKSFIQTKDQSTQTAIKWVDQLTPNGPPRYTTPTTFTDSYDYTTLGDALNMNLVPVRRGNRPTFQVVIATNGGLTSGDRQLNVYGIDAGSGAKIWEWQRPYGMLGTTANPISNSVPGGTSTYDVDGDGNMDRVYVGDMEGKVWELNILTGANLNYFATEGGSTAGSYPLFDNTTVSQYKDSVGAQPVTTAPAIMRLPYDLTNTQSFSGLKRTAAGRLALVFGTGGSDWAPATKTGVFQGRLYVVATQQEDNVVRRKLTYDVVPVPASLKTTLSQVGTTQPDALIYRELAAGERIVGAPKIVGSTILTTTAYGNIDTNFMTSSMSGRTHLIDMTKGSGWDAPLPNDSGKSAAGVLVLPNGAIVTQSMTGIQETKPSAVTLPKMGLAGKRTPVRVGSWLDMGNAFSE